MELNNHEEIFINSYSRLRGWAIHIAQQDYELAEDLLHDAFIEFTRTQPDLKNINNTDAYLYGVIRNLHLSHLRKKMRREKHTLTIIDFETMRLGLRNVKFLDNFQTQEELKRICYFLSLRKESSKSASVMILRFFHGYFPGEIAEVMRATTQVVKVRLNTARNEARAVIENNDTVEAIEKRISPELIVKNSFRSNVDLSFALGEMIFRSTNGFCLSVEELKKIYDPDAKTAVDTKTLAHIVSCRKCIDTVNDLLNLLPISERYSVDFIGKDSGGPGNQSGNGGGMSEDFNEKILLNWQRGSKENFEHEPRELFLCVNGDVTNSQVITQNISKLFTEITEPLEFIEIFSEQDVRLAFFSFSELQDWEKQNLTINLSDERQISLELKKAAANITVETVYNDPHFEENLIFAENLDEEVSFADFLTGKNKQAEENELFGSLLSSREKNRNSFIEKLKNAFVPSFVGFKTAFAGGSLAVLAITAILFAKFFVFVPQISAQEIMRKTVNTEQLNENDTEKIVHRVLNFEEKSVSGETIKKRRIEFFNDAVRKTSVRRVFDENNQLIAGEWRRKDGVSTIYSAGKSELRLSQSDKELINNNLDNIWQLSVSAKGFESLINSAENVNIEEQNNEYQINYLPKTDSGITKAVLYINQEMRANKLILTINQNNLPRDFYFTEAVFEQKLRATVENSVFEPNREFVKNTTASGKNTSQNEKTETESGEKLPLETTAKDSTNPTISTNPATAELEVKVLQMLNNVNALSGDQINIIKTSDGKIQVKGIVDAKNRKDEILNALTEVRGNPAISVNIVTAEEAAKNKPSKNNGGTLESISVESKNSIPAGEILRNHFAAQGISDDKIEAEIRRYASNILSKSSQMRRSALQMKQIADRFSPAELEKMDEATKNNWRRLIKQNAANVAQNSENLRGELNRTLQIGAGNSGGNFNAASDADLIRTAKRLFDLSLAIDNDVRASFSSSGGNRANVSAKSAKFVANLSEIIGISRQLR